MSGLVPLPPQPAGVPWPTEEWPEGELPPGVDLAPLLDEVFDDEGPLATTFAVLVVHRGRVVAERYHGALEHFDRAAHAGDGGDAAAQLVDGQVDAARGRRAAGRRGPARPRRPGRRARVVGPGRPPPRHHAAPAARHARRARLRGGLRRRPGLRRDPDALRRGAGRHGALRRRPPAGGRRPARASTTRRGRRTSSRASWPAPSGPGEDYARFLHGRLFGPIGMASADPEFDEAGTWVASSYVRATARDYARFGLLYLRDGMWDGVRLLPAGWVDYGRTMVSIDDPDGPQPLRRPLVGRGRRHAREPRPARHLPRLGLRGPDDHDLPRPRPGRRPPGQDAARARGRRSSPWRAAMVQAFADAR